MELIKEFCNKADLELLELKEGSFLLVDKMDDDRIIMRGSEFDMAKYIVGLILDFEERSEFEDRIFKGLTVKYFES